MLSTIKTTFIFSITIVILLFIVQNCDNPVEPIDEGCADTTFMPLKTDGLAPLKVGNYWEYKLESFDGGDTINPLYTNYIVHKVRNTHYKILDCNMYETFELDRSFGDGIKWLFWQDTAGYYVMGGIGDEDSLITKNLLFKYPVEEGENWKYPDLFFNNSTQKFEFGDTLTYTCVSTNKKFHTPAGEFSCYVYYWRRRVAPDMTGFYDVYEYINPSIGFVGQEIFVTIETLFDTATVLGYRSQLINYKLN